MSQISVPDGGCDAAAHHAIWVDDQGILRLAIHGVWTKPEVDRFFMELAPVHAMVRKQWGRVLTIVEVGAVQSPLVALHVRNHALAMKRSSDRNAMVVATFLSRLQIRRLGSAHGVGLFTDTVSAKAWLFAEMPPS